MSQNPKEQGLYRPVPQGAEQQHNDQIFYNQPLPQQYEPNDNTNFGYSNPQQQNPPVSEPLKPVYDRGNGVYGESEFGIRLDYSNNQWRDLVWAIVFLVHLVIIFISLISVWSNLSSSESHSGNKGIGILVLCAIIGGIFSIAWMEVMKRAAGFIIKLMLYINLFVISIVAIAAIAQSEIGTFVVCLIFLLLFSCYFYSIRKRIPFATVIIEIGTTIIRTYPGTVWVAILFLVLEFLWVLIWGATAMGYTAQNSYNGFAAFLLILSLYWTLEVLKNTVHVTAAGVTAAWFFSSSPSSPTSGALKRACTTSLGSICLGSLLVAIVRALRALVRSSRDSANGAIQCILDCMLNCLENLIRYFNVYAFAQVAIYGTPYCESAKATWSLLQKKGVDAMINDDLTGLVVACGAFISGLVTGSIGGVVAHNTASLKSEAVYYLIAGFFIGFFLCAIILNVVCSATVTLFVCWAEDPQAMAVNRPAEHERFTSAWKQVYG